MPLQPVVYYRSFQFADSLEGTRASLMRHRKQSPNNMPEYLPSNFNSRQQTANSILLTDEVIRTINLVSICVLLAAGSVERDSVM